MFPQRMVVYRNLFSYVIKRTLAQTSVKCERFGYSLEDSSYILDRINDLNNVSGNLIGVSNKKKLETHLKQNGQFQGLEDLLKVHGLGPKSIKRICDNLISVQGEPQVTESTTQRSLPRRSRLPLIIPAINEAQASLIKTVGSVNIGTNEITWSKVNCISKNLEVWDSYNLDPFTSSKKFDLITLITLSKEVVEKLPACDIYILEDLNVTGYGGSSGGGLPRNFLISIISTLLHQPNSGSTPKVALIAGRAVAKWSGRLVGSEKISSQSLISDIIVNLNDSNSPSGLNRISLPLLYAEPDLRSTYCSTPSVIREALADCLLLALAFIDIAINRRESINEPKS